MKRKFFIALAIAVMSVTCAIGLVACNNDSGTDSHTHTYATEWSYDERYHWHAATCGHGGEVSDKAEHSWNNGTDTEEGGKMYTCTVCGATKTEPSIYSQGLEFDLNDDETSYIVTGKGTCDDYDISIPPEYKRVACF